MPRNDVHGTTVHSEDAKTEEQKDQEGSSVVRFQLKDGVQLEDIQMIDPRLLIVLGHFMIFAEKNNLPVKVTSIIHDRENVQAVSRTHETGRAIDISSKGWPEHKVQEATEQLLHIANHYGAISYSDGERRVIIHHEYKGQGDHFHLQVAK